MKFGLFFELQCPKPLDADQWHPGDEQKVIMEAIEQIEFADKLGYDYVFEVEHDFLEEYAHSSAPEVVLAAASQRTKNIRLGHGIIHAPPGFNHPIRVAERIATLDIVSNGRVEFGTGEGGEIENTGFDIDPTQKKAMWEEATREAVKMMVQVPYEGIEGQFVNIPSRNIIPKPLQKPHPPLWTAASRRETIYVAARLGIGALGFGFDTAEESKERIERYWELVREECDDPIGYAINPAVTALGSLMCCPTDEEAVEKGITGAQMFGFLIGRGQRNYGRDHFHREFKALSAENRQSVYAQRQGLVGIGEEPEDESARSLYRASQRGGFMGSPEFIRNSLRQYEEAHIDMVLFIAQSGDRPHEDIMASMELFAKEVMPEFQDRHHLHQQWREQQLQGVTHAVNSSI
jgi:alkanesulfonate monooxygenase SsuD/methylene tetrahydromethanopterin reductase-like flavin-dependent oxidoreductase (luciferase family)